MYKNKEEYFGLYLKTTFKLTRLLGINAFLMEFSEMVESWYNSSSKPFPIVFTENSVYLPDNDYSPEMASFAFQEYINYDSKQAKYHIEQNFCIISEIENPFGAGKMLFVKNFIND